MNPHRLPRQDWTVTEQQLAREIENYQQQPRIVGPGNFGPNIQLQGDDKLPCFPMNVDTGEWSRLKAGWRTSLRDFT